MNAFLSFVVAISLLIAPCAWGQNAPASAPTGNAAGQNPAGVETQDPRLDAPVTIAGRSQPLRKIIKGLSVPKGPEMRVGNDIAWERVTVYAAKQPARRIMDGLRSLLNYAWIHDDSGPVPQWDSFVLAERTRAYEADLRREMLERGATRLFQLADYLRTPADEFMKQRRTLEASDEQPKDPLLRNANLYYLSKEHPRQALEVLTTLRPAQREGLLRDGDYLLTWDEMDPHQRDLALGLAGDIQDDRSNSQAPQARPGEDDLAWVKSFGLMLYVERDPLTGVVTSFEYGLGGTRYHAGQPPQDLPMHDLFNVRGNPYKSRYGMHLPIYPRLEAQRFPTDFKLNPVKVATWGGVMEELSRYIEIPIYSDSYSFLPTPQDRSHLTMPDLKNCTLVAGLDALCNWYRYLWWYQDGALFFRSRTWLEERLYEVPPPVLSLLRRKLANGSALDVEALDALAGLTLPQLEGLNAQVALDLDGLDLVNRDQHSYEVLRATSECDGAYAYLQTYARLGSEQKERFLTAEGVPLAEVAPEIRNLFLRDLFRHNFSGFRGDLTRLRLRATQNDLPSNDPKQKTIHRLNFDDLPGMVQVAYDSHARPKPEGH